MPVKTFRCNGADSFADVYAPVCAHLATHGFAIVDAWNAEPATLASIAQRFGRVQLHVRADAAGIVGISTDAKLNPDWQAYRSEYSGLTSEEFLPHTDGSFVQGLARDGDGYVQLFPPKMLILQCAQNAAVGGGNVLIDGQRIYEDLVRDEPRMLQVLSTKGSVAYCRDDQMALDCAVFEALDDGAVMLRFRYDAAAYVAQWAFDAFHALQARYFSSPRYRTEVGLVSGQVLLVDNYRMLHGRAAFGGADSGPKRSMRRMWVARDRLPVLRNAADEHREKRALKRYEPYGVLAAAPAPAPRLALGIRRPGPVSGDRRGPVRLAA